MVKQVALNHLTEVRFLVGVPKPMQTNTLIKSENKVALDTKLEQLKVVAGKFIPKLNKLNIKTVRDLLWHFPARYEDYRIVSKIADIKEGQAVTIRAEVKKISTRKAWNRNLYIVEAILTDETGGFTAVWFNQPFLTRLLKPGMRANFAGKIMSSKKGLFLSNPSYEVLKGTTQTKHTAGLIPIYPETRGLTSKGVRHLTKLFLEIISDVEDFIPQHILEKYDLPPLRRALNLIHFPKSTDQAQKAKKRFYFEYLFLLQLNNQLFRRELAKEKAPALKIERAEMEKLLSSLPFELTASQKQSLEELLSDIEKEKPMNRLLQGDVGSGKTAVAALAAMVASHNGKQAVFMAPTEVLARQHYKTITSIFSHIETGVCLLTGSEARVFYGKNQEAKVSKVSAKKAIEKKEVSIIIGTHALIHAHEKKSSSGLRFPALGLVVIDEQHRFGVRQRASLIKRSGKHQAAIPHFLSMSATPIPRTLTLTVFGDLDLSTINELPRGRKAIITKIVNPLNRPKAHAFIKEHLKKGRQAFFIYPRISVSGSEVDQREKDKRKLNWSEVKNVEEEYKILKEKIFPGFKIGMLHGKLKPKEKQEVMADFQKGKIDILASTSVVEVGVDVPNATIMVIEGADRFGLSQLYQFRGRVGRGSHQSFCFLFTDSNSESTHARLKALLEAKNGFELAEKDLELRGPGEFLGEKQTGVPDKAMSALSDIQLIKLAQDAAKKLLEEDFTLQKFPLLKSRLEQIKVQAHLE